MPKDLEVELLFRLHFVQYSPLYPGERALFLQVYDVRPVDHRSRRYAAFSCKHIAGAAQNPACRRFLLSFPPLQSAHHSFPR